jgi:methionyl-tRNA formyltransferase
LGKNRQAPFSAAGGIRDPRIVLAGSVGSSLRTLRSLLEHHARVVGVLGLAESAAAGVSDYLRLDGVALEAGVPYRDFVRLDDPEVAEVLRSWAPDVLFVVGLSQLVRRELLELPKLACVGFHPTRLPEGRGRAPVAWIILDGVPAAATFFVLEETADSGPVLVQEPFEVAPDDHAPEVLAAMEQAIDRALERWLPELLAGSWSPVPQDESRATVYGRRAPEDGLIDWHRPAQSVVDLIRATSRPHPGAYTHVDGHRLIIWQAAVEEQLPYRGAVGRILWTDPKRGALVQAGSGLVWLRETEWVSDTGLPTGAATPRLGVGARLGGCAADEIAALRRRLALLEERLSQAREARER